MYFFKEGNKSSKSKKVICFQQFHQHRNHVSFSSDSYFFVLQSNNCARLHKRPEWAGRFRRAWSIKTGELQSIFGVCEACRFTSHQAALYFAVGLIYSCFVWRQFFTLPSPHIVKQMTSFRDMTNIRQREKPNRGRQK